MGVLGASLELVDILEDPGGGMGATLNLVHLSSNLLDAAASLWTSGRLGHFRSVGRRLGGPQGGTGGTHSANFDEKVHKPQSKSYGRIGANMQLIFTNIL